MSSDEDDEEDEKQVVKKDWIKSHVLAVGAEGQREKDGNGTDAPQIGEDGDDEDAQSTDD